VKRWNTSRLAGWGAAGGALFSAVQNYRAWSFYGVEAPSVAGELICGAFGGAIIVALVSGARNLILRASKAGYPGNSAGLSVRGGW
jgi:hypothetical protein